MKSHFGSVEIKSIAQATAINEEGFYYVGNILDDEGSDSDEEADAGGKVKDFKVSKSWNFC